MTIMEEFLQHIQNGDTSFIIYKSKNTKKLIFTSITIGKATFFYLGRIYGSESVVDKLEMAAVIANNTVYIIDTYEFNAYSDNSDPIPAGMMLWSELKESISNQTKQYAEQFYDTLPVTQINEEYMDTIKQNVRDHILKNTPESYTEPYEILTPKITPDEIKEILTGKQNLKTMVYDKMNEQRDIHISRKTDKQAFNDMLHDKNVVEQYEKDICDGISIDAKFVTINFEFKNKTATGKIEPSKLRRIIAHNDCFTEYNFATWKEGKQIITHLNPSTYSYDNEADKLTGKNITSITYGKKVLYEKTLFL